MADESKDGKKAGGIMPVLIGVVLTVLVGLGAGFGAATFLTAVPPPGPVAKPAEAAGEADAAAQGGETAAGGHGAAAEGAPGDGTAEEEEPGPVETALVPLPPVVANMAAPANAWIRLEGSVEYDVASEKKPDLLAAETSQAILHYLRTIKLAEIQSPDGIHFMSQDIDEIVRSLSSGQVRSVLITGLIVE